LQSTLWQPFSGTAGRPRSLSREVESPI
jgi:hypothetical protein